ncbi:hypothetical protein [Streptomyces sp. NPDC056672]|uniref:hypothetical protein n=1 Tax=Streptomyces sp. NPDC056672 TaxID=3345906 RepID=UPI0036B78FB6
MGKRDERETWTTEEFATSHEGAVGVLLADGAAPERVFFDMGSAEEDSESPGGASTTAARRRVPGRLLYAGSAPAAGAARHISSTGTRSATRT